MPKISRYEWDEQVEKVIECFDSGITKRREIANILGIHVSTVSRIINNYRDNKDMILARERTAWELRQKGRTHQQIADEMQLSRSGITRILKRINDRILEKLEDKVKELKIEQWGQLEYVISESLAAWELSKQPSREVTRRQLNTSNQMTEAAKESAASATEIITTKVADLDGTVVYLNVAMAAMNDLRDLLGLNVKKVAATDPSGEKSGPPTQILYYLPENGRNPVEEESANE